MIKKGLIWMAIGVVIFVLFFLMPLDLYNQYQIYLSIFGAIFITVCVYKMLSKFTGRQNLSIIIASPLCFVMLLVLYFGFFSKKKNELEVIAKIENAKATALRRTEDFSLKLSFKTNDGEVVQLYEAVNKKEFFELIKQDSVRIIYSSRYPGIIDIK